MKPQSYFSVVRYVPDPIRNEPRNIGVLVVCPERNWARGKFSLSRTGLASTSPRFDFLRTIIAEFDRRGRNQMEFWAPLSPQLTVEELRGIADGSTNVLQFTAPIPAPGEPQLVLDGAYRDFVAPRHVGGSGAWSRSSAIHVFRRSFDKVGLTDWVQEAPQVSLAHEPPYVFDLGIGNGTWRALIENISFRGVDPQKPEERAAWVAVSWTAIQREIDAQAILFIQESAGAERRIERASKWATDAGVKVYASDRAPVIADELARQSAGAAVH